MGIYFVDNPLPLPNSFLVLFKFPEALFLFGGYLGLYKASIFIMALMDDRQFASSPTTKVIYLVWNL